jgi:DNA ligase-associated metallophosphoesterase
VLVADLHLGKGEAMFAQGAPLTPAAAAGVLDEQLARLGDLVACTGASRVIVLGDLLHAPAGITEGMVERVRGWRATLPASFELVPGNHDRKIERVLDAWGVRLLGAVEVERGIVLRHDPRPDGRGPVVAGHVHPAVRLGRRGEAVKLPCFWRTREAVGSGPQRVEGDALVLPAFTLFASGVVVEARAGDGVYAVAGDRVVGGGGGG